MTFQKPINKTLVTLLLIAATGVSQTQAQISQTPDQKLRAELLELQQSGKDGSLKVAAIFAKCHGFQAALYSRLTQDIVLGGAEMEFAQKISKQSIEAGRTAFLFTVSNDPAPKFKVDKISKATREKWKPLLTKPGDIDDLIWQNLLYCEKIAPMSHYMVEEIEMHDTAKNK